MGDNTVGDPHRAQNSQFELFELVLLLKLGKQFSVEQFEPTVSQSAVSSPPLKVVRLLCTAGADKDKAGGCGVAFLFQISVYSVYAVTRSSYSSCFCCSSLYV